jgi:hypothetical protein
MTYRSGRPVALVAPEGDELATGWEVSVDDRGCLVLHIPAGGTICLPDPPMPRPSRWLRLAGVALLSAACGVAGAVYWMISEVS